MSASKNPFSERIATFLTWAERILLTLLVIGLFLYNSEWRSDILLMLSLSGLGMIFFLSAYMPVPFPREDGQKLNFVDLFAYGIAPKILGIGSSVMATGLLFYLLSLKGSTQMLLVGSTTTGVVSFLVILLTVQNQNYLKPLLPFLYRAIPLATASAAVLLL